MMMRTVILWALLTGGTIGVTWLAIVFGSRLRRLMEEQRDTRATLDDVLEQINRLEAHLSESSERLDFAERQLASLGRRTGSDRPPTDGG